MKVMVFDNVDKASEYVFDIFKEELANGAKSFGLATGSTPEPLYKLISESDLDFTQAVSINLDEYYGLGEDHPQSYNHYMHEKLFDAKPFKANFLPNGLEEDVEAECKRYDKIIEDNPVDLQILGIGTNAHIGFNEPGASFEGKTQLVDLAEETIEANKRFFESADDVPRKAYSMGIASIMQAKKIVLLAFGENKAQAIKDSIEGEVTEDVPASALQNHPDVTFVLDKGAASLLSE